MLIMTQQVPFTPGEWLVDENNPGRPGIFTGNTQVQGPFFLIELEYGPSDRRFRPAQYLQSVNHNDDDSLDSRIKAGNFGKLADFRKLITFEKLQGTLHEVIYSMESAQIDFYPYQYKPVVKFINSPTERMIIADEVGLGKTIEAALIWIELQSRKRARRLLVVCPTQILAQKWKNELREKFIIDAQLVNFSNLRETLEELRASGESNSFALISTYNALRPPRNEHKFLDEMVDETENLSPKTKLYQELRNWELGFNPFDLVIFDEAHHMRNAGTANFRLGESLSKYAGAVLCVSATPVNNRNEDLHSILRLIDEDFFRNQSTFNQLLQVNKPAVQLVNALARTPVDQKLLAAALEGLGHSPFISKSPLFKKLLTSIESTDFSDHSEIAACQDIAEKLNLLGGYVTRTRRLQVKEHRPVREPFVLQIEFTPMEMKLYNAIIEIVRRRCLNEDRAFHIFQEIGLQMRASSSLPVLAEEIKAGNLGNPYNLLVEGFGDLDDDDCLLDDIDEDDHFDINDVRELLNYDFEMNDSKYNKLENHILQNLAGEKVIIFSFYRGTLAYLYKRLGKAGIHVVQIHGGIPHEDRKEIVDGFNSEGGPRVLLSSEVGSEGIDMHEYCRCLINYDMPWNPMRVEQRIGRIDRVGQKAERLSIIHLKVKDTIEERVYDRLHHRLELFSNSLGDLESVVGNIVKDLTVELLSNKLTPDEEEQRIAEKERILHQKLKDLEMLEESGDMLIALSDYVQKKIDEDRGKGRFIQPAELELYIKDFFGRKYQGTTINFNTPSDGCIKVRLSSEARDSLRMYISDDHSLSANPLRMPEFTLSFRRDVLKALSNRDKHRVHFANHLSPFVRWMTKEYSQDMHNFFNFSAMKLKTSLIKSGTWTYRIERWSLSGLRKQEQLSYAIICQDDGQILSKNESENIIQLLLHDSTEWDYPEVDLQNLSCSQEILADNLTKKFNTTIEDFMAENKHSCLIRIERARNLFDRKIEQIKQKLQTLRERGRTQNIIRLMETQLKNAENNRMRKLNELQSKMEVDCEKRDVAAGVFYVEQVN